MNVVALFMFLFLAACPIFAQKVVIVANRGTHLDQMSAADVRAVFTGADTNLPGNVRAVPVLLRGGAVQDTFLKDYIGKLDTSFRTAWRSLVFSGQATMPKSAEDEAEMLSYVAKTPGAIGYVSKLLPRDNVITVTVR